MHAPCKCNMSIMDPTIHMVLQIRYARPVSKLCITVLSSLIKNKNRKISQLLMLFILLKNNKRNRGFNKMEMEYAIIKILICGS